MFWWFNSQGDGTIQINHHTSTNHTFPTPQALLPFQFLYEAWSEVSYWSRTWAWSWCSSICCYAYTEGEKNVMANQGGWKVRGGEGEGKAGDLWLQHMHKITSASYSPHTARYHVPPSYLQPLEASPSHSSWSPHPAWQTERSWFWCLGLVEGHFVCHIMMECIIA